MDRIEVTMDDVNELLRVNPVAAEQIKVIALQRMLAAEQALRSDAEAKACIGCEGNVPKEAVEGYGRPG